MRNVSDIIVTASQISLSGILKSVILINELPLNKLLCILYLCRSETLLHLPASYHNWHEAWNANRHLENYVLYFKI